MGWAQILEHEGWEDEPLLLAVVRQLFLRVPFRSRGFGWGWVLPFCGSCAHVRLGGVAVPVVQGGGEVVVWCFGSILFGLFGILQADGA